MLEPWLAEFDGLLAQAPARAHDLVLVSVDDRRVVIDRVVVDAVSPGAGPFIDVDGRPGRDRRDVLDVEVRLAAARPGGLAPVDGDYVQPLEHARRRARTEVARIERLDVRAQERLEFVERDVLARAEIAAAVEPECAVRAGDLVVCEPTELAGRRGGARAGLRRVSRMIEAHRPGRPDLSAVRGGRAQDPYGTRLHQIIQAHDGGDRTRDRGGQRNAGCRRVADGTVAQPVVLQPGMESALDLRGGSAEAHQQAIARHPAHLQAVCPQLRAHGADRRPRGTEPARKGTRWQVPVERW